MLGNDFDPDGLVKSATSIIFLSFFASSFFFLRGNSLTIRLGQYHLTSTLPHKSLLHFEEKKFRESESNRGKEGESEEEDGRVKMKSSGEGKGGSWRKGGKGGREGAQFTKAALNQPITVKENISWCISSPHEEKRMKGEEGECI